MANIGSFKKVNAEGARESQFITRVADAVHGRANQQRLVAIFVALRETVVMLEQVGFVSVAAYLALHGRITIGVLFAILAYKTQFITAGTHIIEKVIAFRLLRLHLDRVAATASADFFPLPAAPSFLAHQTSRRLAILRCAPARSRVRRRSLPAC